METAQRRLSPATISLVVIASLMVIAFLKQAQIVVLPIMVSAFLAILLFPLILLLQRHRWPILPAALLSLSLVFLLVLLCVSLLTMSLQSLGSELPLYWERLTGVVSHFDELLLRRGVNLHVDQFLRSFDWINLSPVVTKSFGLVVDFAKYGTMIFFITLFMLVEAPRLKEKAARTFGERNLFSDSMLGVAADVQRYLVVKTVISLATGALVGLYLWLLDVPFPLLWGTVTFLFNYIPNVGSIVASIPPVLLGFMHPTAPLMEVFKIGAGLLLIQTIFGSYLDPRLMGKNLNLSVLVVFLSMVSWGWLWGPAGMLISVPLTVCVKVALAHHSRTRPFALLLEG